MLLRRERPRDTVERVTDEISFCADRDVLEALIATPQAGTSCACTPARGWHGAARS